MLSKEALEQLADQAVSNELVHLLANTDIQTGQLCSEGILFCIVIRCCHSSNKCHHQVLPQ